MEISKNEKRLLSPNKIVLPIATNENGILDEYIQTNDKNCLEIFTCSICSCLAWDPVCCPKCDKPFCRACISKYGKNKSCPFGCDNDFFREITRNEKNFLNKIKLKCTNVGCSKYIQYSDYVTHLEKCNLRKYHCKNQSCKEEGYINDMMSHTVKCPYRIVECAKCKQNIKFCEIKSHKLEHCPEVVVKCTMCGTSMKRGLYLKEHKSENNENVKCLKLQVERWAKTYNDDMNNKNKEINELKTKIKDMEKVKRENDVQINNLKRLLGEIKNFYQNGFNKFFADENINISNFNISHEISKKFESNSKILKNIKIDYEDMIDKKYLNANKNNKIEKEELNFFIKCYNEDKEDIDNKNMFEEEKIDKKKYYKDEDVDFSDGDIIDHDVYGKGVVVSISGDIITVAFSKKYGIKKLLKNYKGITKG